MTVQGAGAVLTRTEARRDVEVYDFQRPTTLAREQSRTLELAFETFARQWGTQLTAKIRVISRVALEGVVMQTYDDYAASLPGASAMVLCALDDVAARAVVQFPASAALGWIGRMLGGADRVPAPERTFTPVEQNLVRRLMEDALEDLAYSLGSLLTAGITLETIQVTSQFAQAAATTDMMIVARFAVRVGERTTGASIAIPAAAMLARLGGTGTVTGLADAPARLRRQIAGVPVQVALQLAPAAVDATSVLRLAVGDVIPLPHPTHRPLSVVVDGVPVAAAAAGTSGARLACVVVDPEED